MLTRLNVNGFKSLSRFKLSFEPSLNVLIGPNGAGKTNICQSIGLLSSLADGTILEYILKIGGINSIFRLRNLTKRKDKSINKRKRNINIYCEGLTSSEYKDEMIKIKYSYSFSLEFKEKLKIKNERLKIFRKTSKNRYKNILESEKINILSMKIKDTTFIGPVDKLLEEFIKQKKKVKSCTIKIKDTKETKGTIMLNGLAVLFFIVYLVKEDIRKSKAFNIDPYIARQPSELIEPVEMLSDGRRLSNSLFFMNDKNKKAFDNINNFITTVFPSFSNLIPKLTSDGLKRTFAIKDKKGIVFDAYNLSDGVIKLIALLVGIFEQRHNTIIIEEPENYLHPWVCNILIDYFRDLFKDRVCLLTTHSETILNLVKPKEIIVCENRNGITKSFRIKDPKIVEDVIKSTGFGCGYHYVTGSLGGTSL